VLKWLAQAKIEMAHIDPGKHNLVRPHSSLGYRTPIEFGREQSSEH
jgi:transposase InsO family protein